MPSPYDMLYDKWAADNAAEAQRVAALAKLNEATQNAASMDQQNRLRAQAINDQRADNAPALKIYNEQQQFNLDKARSDAIAQRNIDFENNRYLSNQNARKETMAQYEFNDASTPDARSAAAAMALAKLQGGAAQEGANAALYKQLAAAASAPNGMTGYKGPLPPGWSNPAAIAEMQANLERERWARGKVGGGQEFEIDPITGLPVVKPRDPNRPAYIPEGVSDTAYKSQMAQQKLQKLLGALDMTPPGIAATDITRGWGNLRSYTDGGIDQDLFNEKVAQLQPQISALASMKRAAQAGEIDPSIADQAAQEWIDKIKATPGADPNFVRQLMALVSGPQPIR